MNLRKWLLTDVTKTNRYYKLLPVVGPIVITVAVGAGVERPAGQALIGKNEQAPDVNSISSTAISPV